MDRAAFSEWLFNLSLALFASDEGDPQAASDAYDLASIASGFAFPLDSPESRAMGVLLDAVAPALTAGGTR